MISRAFASSRRERESTFGRHIGAGIQMMLGADGVHSVLRNLIIGPDAPIHKGRTEDPSSWYGDAP